MLVSELAQEDLHLLLLAWLILFQLLLPSMKSYMPVLEEMMRLCEFNRFFGRLDRNAYDFPS